MAAEVRAIFKVLIGTPLLIVVISLVIELYNINISGMQLRQMTKMAVKQSAKLFTQETYKEGTDGAGTVVLPDIMAARQTYDNTHSISVKTGGSDVRYVTGDFYNVGAKPDPYAVWDAIYTTSDFQSFLDLSEGGDTGLYEFVKKPKTVTGKSKIREIFPVTDYIYEAVQRGNEVYDIDKYKIYETAGLSQDEIKERRKNAQIQRIWDTITTTSNVGIPYLDSTIMNRMLRYNLTQLLSDCKPSLIQIDEYGNYFVNYNGFRCYTSLAQISHYRYRMYDMTDPDDLEEFAYITGMSKNEAEADWRGASRASYSTSETDSTRVTSKENDYVTVVGIEYRIPISYTGITPIKRIFNWVWNTEVSGFKDAAGNNGAGNLDNANWSGENARSNVGGNNNTAIQYLNAGGSRTSDTGTDVKSAGGIDGLLDHMAVLQYTLIR